jgi:hypothetical protein
MKQDFALGKVNLVIIAVSVVVIVAGFALMAGGGSEDPSGFNPEVFSYRRIVIAPAVTLAGFVLTGIGILWKTRGKQGAEE